MIEWYRVGAGTAELMDDVESMIGAAATALGQATPQWSRVAVSDLMESAGHTDNGDEEAWFRAWVDRVEPTLTTPTFVHGYPPWQAALSQIRGPIADRFEVYLGGLEIGNAFAEEGCADALLERFIDSGKKRINAGKTAHPIDDELLAATPRMPRCSGIAIGIDRLVMALSGAKDIAEVQVR